MLGSWIVAGERRVFRMQRGAVELVQRTVPDVERTERAVRVLPVPRVDERLRDRRRGGHRIRGVDSMKTRFGMREVYSRFDAR